jgi:phosphopentomutase
LVDFDRRIPEIAARMGARDILLITADHGNDPTTPGTDHSRERVPLLVSGAAVKPNCDLGTRASFADVAATTADLLGVKWSGSGRSFADSLLR